MPIERLPYTPISYPVMNYPVIPRPPVTPWAAIAANLANTISQTAKDLSPAEREKKADELAILGAQVRHANVSTEYEQMQLDAAHRMAEAVNSPDSGFNQVGQITNGILNPDKEQSEQPKTTPADLSLGGNYHINSGLNDLNEPDTSIYSAYHDDGTTLGEPPITFGQDYSQQAMQGVEEGKDMTMDLSPPATDTGDEGELSSFANSQ